MWQNFADLNFCNICKIGARHLDAAGGLDRGGQGERRGPQHRMADAHLSGPEARNAVEVEVMKKSQIMFVFEII